MCDSSPRQYLFVCEDDMLPHSHFSELFPLYWEQVPKDFDIVMVGNTVFFKEGDPLVVSRPSLTTHSYIVSKKGAAKLYNLYRQLPRSVSKNRKIDASIYIIDVFLYQLMSENKIQFYCFNGSIYPDHQRIALGEIKDSSVNGICFQNFILGTSLLSKDIQPNHK